MVNWSFLLLHLHLIGGLEITNYEYSLNSGSTWTALSPADATSPVTITGLTNGTSYNVQLRAINTLGGGAASATLSTNTTPRTLPTVTINSVTNFNQELATYNATVSWGGASTTVTFEWSRDDSSWSTASARAGTAVGSPVTTNSASVYFNASDFLSQNNGQPFYVRAKGVNAAGTVYSNSTSFTPWTLKTQGPSDTNGSRIIDTVTPTGGSAQPVYIYQIAVVGGGGGSGYAGGGGGGVLNSYASALVTDGSRTVSWTIGGGGAAALEFSNTTDRAGTGGATSISGTNTTISAAGGQGAQKGAANGQRPNDGGSSGVHASGGGRYDLTNKSAIYSGGGGAGTNGAGGTVSNYNIPYNSNSGPPAYEPTAGSYVGGAAGASATAHGLTGGGGGSGSGSAGQGTSHASAMYGKGGDGGDPNAMVFPGGSSGNAGAIIFKYYGP